MKELFENVGQWYKGNLHAHTTLSDGRKTPEEVSQIFYDKGYDFLVITDHRKPSKASMYKDMLLIPGAEWDYGNNINQPVYHILSIGTESDLDLPECYKNGHLPDSDEIKPQDIVNRINEHGGVAVLAHPAWSVMNANDLFDIEGFAAAEIYNSISTTPWNAKRADSSQYFDLWASRGLFVSAVAADDCHFYKGEHAKSYIMVNAKSKTHGDILDAIRKGNFYASQGPQFLSITYDNSKVVVKCSKDVTRMIFYSNSVWVDKRVFDDVNGEVVYEIPATDKYVRIELIDKDGKMAWCSPFAI